MRTQRADSARLIHTQKTAGRIWKPIWKTDAAACPTTLRKTPSAPFCVGRRNWLFSDSPAGAQASARVYTMVQMARAHNLNVERYLTFLLENRPTMAMSDAELERLLPWGQQAQSFCSSGFAQ